MRFFLILVTVFGYLSTSQAGSYKFTKTEVCAAIFLAVGDMHVGAETSGAQIEVQTKEAMRLVNNFKIGHLPAEDTNTWNFDETVVNDRTTDLTELKTATGRIKGLQRTYDLTLVPENQHAQYATDGLVISGEAAIQEFIAAVGTGATYASFFRNKYVEGLRLSILEILKNGSPRSQVKKAENFHKLFESLFENITDAVKNRRLERWIYWGANSQISQYYADSLGNPWMRPAAWESTARLDFPQSEQTKRNFSEDAVEVAFDLVFKFEGSTPTLTVFMRYGTPRDLPPTRPKKKIILETATPAFGFQPSLVPVPAR